MTIRDGVQWGFTQIGKPYNSDWDKRFGPDAYDCSGFVSQVLWHAGMPQGTLPTNSADIARWLRQNEAYRLSRVQARATYGAVIILGGVNGYGPAGHIGISLGDGRTIESAGSRGVAIYGFDRLMWSDFMLAPGVNYATPTPPPPPPTPNPMKESEMVLMRGNATPHVWIVNGPWKTHVTADAYPFWLFFCTARGNGAVDPTTKKEWVVDQKMIDAIPDTATAI